MNLNRLDDIRTCCDATGRSAPVETSIKPDLRPVKKADLIGTLHHFPSVPSLYIKARNVDVWLPPNYERRRCQQV
jgi:hypothetical protein